MTLNAFAARPIVGATASGKSTLTALLTRLVDPDHGRPRHVFGADELDEVRGSHVLAPALPVLRRTLLDAADEAVHMMIVTDARGHILWREGNTGVLRRADDVALVEGTRWSEDSIGTNAMGTALADGRAAVLAPAFAIPSLTIAVNLVIDNLPGRKALERGAR